MTSQGKHGYSNKSFEDTKCNRYLRCIAELANGQLVTRESDGDRMYLRTHRATQDAMLYKLNNELNRREATFCRVVNLLRENLPSSSKLQTAEAPTWPLIKRVLPHLSGYPPWLREGLPSYGRKSHIC